MMSFARGRRLYVATSPLSRGLSVVTRRSLDRLSLDQRRRLPTLCATTTTPSHRHCTVNDEDDDDRHKWRPLTSTGARSRVCVKIYGVTSHCFIILYYTYIIYLLTRRWRRDHIVEIYWVITGTYFSPSYGVAHISYYLYLVDTKIQSRTRHPQVSVPPDSCACVYAISRAHKDKIELAKQRTVVVVRWRWWLRRMRCATYDLDHRHHILYTYTYYMVCVCTREREREREIVIVYERAAVSETSWRGRERERERETRPLWPRASRLLYVYVCLYPD